MKKQISMLLCTTLLWSSISMDANASSNTISTELVPISAVLNEQSTETNSTNLKKVTENVKSKITIPSSLKNFDFQYYKGNSSSDGRWNLSWTNAKNNESLYITCDESGNIFNYYHYFDLPYKQIKPVYLREELQPKADQFIKKLLPSIYKNLEAVSSSSYNSYSGSYSYTYRRVHNGIPMPDNSVTVSINYETGTILSASVDWLYSVTIPSSQAKITQEEATKKIKDNLAMKLVYKTSYTEQKDGSNKMKAYLVYEPDNSYISVDAITGEVYLTKDTWIDQTSMTKEESAQDASATGSPSKGSLTEKEIASIEELNSLISKDSAIKKIQSESSLLISEHATSIAANLQQSYRNNGKDKYYTWNIQFNDPRPIKDGEDSYRGYASASVDAKTGKILSFYGSVPSHYNDSKSTWDTVKVQYNKEQSQIILEQFLRSQISSYYNNSVLSNKNDDYIIAYKDTTPIYGGYTYHYDRVYHSIPYPDNRISGSVDGVTGKIYRFHYNWDEQIQFQSSKGTMNALDALNKYLDKDGYELIYEINQNHSLKNDVYSIKPTIRLVFHPNIYPSYISPFTGEQMDWNGEIYQKAPAYIYTDITSSKQKKAILLLSNMGVGFEGTKFKPNQKITTSEFISLLKQLNYNTDELSLTLSSKTITRTNAIKSLIHLAGLKTIAEIPNIYTTNYLDQKDISKKDLGYIALAKGLGIISGTRFRPHSTLTRGEAAEYIVQFLNAEIR